MNDTDNVRMARVGVLFDRTLAQTLHRAGANTFGVYTGEILAHAGLPFQWLDEAGQASDETFDLIIVALAPDNEATASRLQQFAARGGAVVLLANQATLAQRVGWRIAEPSGVGYASLPNMPPLRFLRAIPATAEHALTSTSHGTFVSDQPQGPLILHAGTGAGVVERWAVDPASTVVALQQGVAPVIQDGLPAPDGSGAIDEGILKADDGFTLDWALDRLKTPSGQPYFAYAYADLWREAFVGRLLSLALKMGLTLPFIDYWPDGVELVATISHDSDLNDDDSAITTLGLLEEAGVHSTWCMLEPGYSPAIYEQIQAHGHELAFHYNAVEHENYRWDRDEFSRQLAWMKAATGLPAVTSNKNHYTRFENWGDLFSWQEAAGVQLDQTRGPSKRGNVGLLFGTCHPYFPLAWHDEGNRLYDVLELGFLTQDMDLGAWADSSVIDPFLGQVQRVRGVAHFLFHPIHLHTQAPVRDAFRAVIHAARQRGFTFWTSRQINAWERARRALRIEGFAEQGRVMIRQNGAGAMNDIVVWTPIAGQTSENSDDAVGQRFGVQCRKQVVRVSKRRASCQLALHQPRQEQTWANKIRLRCTVDQRSRRHPLAQASALAWKKYSN